MKKLSIILVTLCLLVSSVLAVSAASIVYGDADGNGKVNNRDLGLLQKHLNGTPVTIDELAMDVDGNGKINNRDLGMLQKHLNNADFPLGPEEPELNEDIYNDTELDWNF